MFGDTALHVGVIVESQAGILSALTLVDTGQLQQVTRGVHKLASDGPLKLRWRIGLCRTEHGQIGSSWKGSRVLAIHC